MWKANPDMIRAVDERGLLVNPGSCGVAVVRVSRVTGTDDQRRLWMMGGRLFSDELGRRLLPDEDNNSDFATQDNTQCKFCAADRGAVCSD
jgi:hypothetical protein